jgi:hypothetical protein
MFISLAATIAVFIIFRSRKSLLVDPYTVFFIAWLYYSYYIPVLMILSGYYDLGDMAIYVTEKDLSSLAQLYFWSFLMFTLAYRGLEQILSKKILIAPQAIDGALHRRILRKQQLGLVAGVAGVAAVTMILFPGEMAAVRMDYANKIYTIYNNSVFAAFQSFWVSLVGVAVAHTIMYSDRPVRIFILAVLGMCALSFTTYSKTPLIFIFFFGLIVSHRVAGKIQLPVITLFILAFMGALVTIVPSFSQYRATGLIEFVNFADMNVQQTYSDARGPLFTTLLSLNYANLSAIPPLAFSWILWIPRFIWPSRPYDVAEAFAQANMPGWQPGFGYGMSPLTEGIMRFDVFFAPAMFLFFGATVVLLRMLFLSLLNERLRPAVDIAFFGQLLFLLNRSPLSGIMTFTLQFWLPFLLILSLLQWFFGVQFLNDDRQAATLRAPPGGLRPIRPKIPRNS